MSYSILDNPQVLKQYDREDMLARIKEMPSLCQSAWQLAYGFDIPSEYLDIDKVVILGMGGSAIGGDLVSNLLSNEASLPIAVCRGYQLPAYVDDKTLLIASSYSGNTEETLSAFQRSLSTKAKIIVITTGGKLKSLAEEYSLPLFHFDYSAQPRAALPFSMLPILCFLQKLKLIGDKSKEVYEASSVMREMGTVIAEKTPLTKNPAKQLAQLLNGNLPVVYGAGILSEVAHRWKTQVNENSKAWCFHEVFPELNHNAVVGYQFPEKLKENIVVVMLNSKLLPERIKLRYEVTCRILEKEGVKYRLIDGTGNSHLAQIMSLVLFGDYTSYYLAILYRTDPSPVKAIDYLKQSLAKEQF